MEPENKIKLQIDEEKYIIIQSALIIADVYNIDGKIIAKEAIARLFPEDITSLQIGNCKAITNKFYNQS